MGAVVLREVPDPDAPGPVAANDLALVGVDYHVVGRALVVVTPLDRARSRLPDLDGPVLGARDHPLALAVEGDTGDVAGMPLERQQRVRVGGFDVVELDGVVARGGEEALIRGDAEAVDLGVGMLDRPRTDAGERFPEANRVVVAGWFIRTSVRARRAAALGPQHPCRTCAKNDRHGWWCEEGSSTSDLAPCVGLRDGECGQ